jgi:transcription elongation factor GreA
MTQYLSPEGLEKIKKELEERKTVLRPEISQKILEAKEQGDITENAEYAEAKELQAFNEGRIGELEAVLKDAVVVEKNGKSTVVDLGSTVRVESKFGIQEFTIVGASESSPNDGFISNESPLGQAFLGKKKGEEFFVETPSGKIKYKILDVS